MPGGSCRIIGPASDFQICTMTRGDFRSQPRRDRTSIPNACLSTARRHSLHPLISRWRLRKRTSRWESRSRPPSWSLAFEPISSPWLSVGISSESICQQILAVPRVSNRYDAYSSWDRLANLASQHPEQVAAVMGGPAEAAFSTAEKSIYPASLLHLIQDLAVRQMGLIA